MAQVLADNERCIREIVIAHGQHAGKTGRCPNPRAEGRPLCTRHLERPVSVNVHRSKVREGYKNAHSAVMKLGLIVDRDPREILLDQVYSAYGMVVAARQLIQDIPVTDMFPMPGTPPDSPAWETKGMVAFYSDWVDRAARLAKMALDAGIDERLVKLAESQSNIVINVLQVVLNDPSLALPAAVQAKFRELAAQEFRRLAASTQPEFEPVEALKFGATPKIYSKTGLEL